VRLDFLPSEKVAIGNTIEKRERKAAKKRKERKPICGGNLPPQNKGDTRDKVAAYLGVSGKTYEKAKTGGNWPRRGRSSNGGPTGGHKRRVVGVCEPTQWAPAYNGAAAAT